MKNAAWMDLIMKSMRVIYIHNRTKLKKCVPNTNPRGILKGYIKSGFFSNLVDTILVIVKQEIVWLILLKTLLVNK